MFARLERYVFPALVALALWAAVLVAVPAVAQAQAAVTKAEGARGADRGAGANLAREVVRPGDSLWSISSEELRPNATPQQIAAGAERIYALNREQIGPDPNLIFAGQRLSVPPASEPPASGRPAGTEPLARKAAEAASDEAASGGAQADRQAEREPVAASRQASASEPVPLPDAAQAVPVPASRPLAAEEPPRPPGEPFVDKARAAVTATASAVVGFFPSDEGYEGHTWRELLGAALLAVSSVAAVLTVVLVLALVVRPEHAKRAQRGGWWREVRANKRAYEGAYEHATFDTSLDEGLENGTRGAHARTNGAHANGNVPLGMILAAERQRGRLRRRRGRPQSPARHVSRGLAHLTYSPGMRRFLRGTSGTRSGTRPRRPASHGG